MFPWVSYFAWTRNEKRQEDVFLIKQRGKFLPNWTKIRESFHHWKCTQWSRFVGQGLQLCYHFIFARFTMIQCGCLRNCFKFVKNVVCWFLPWLIYFRILSEVLYYILDVFINFWLGSALSSVVNNCLY